MASNGLLNCHQPYSNRMQVVMVHGTITGAADVEASGYTVTGPWTTSATRTAEGLVTVKLNRKFNSILQVIPTIQSSTLGDQLNVYHRTAVTSATASGGATFGLQFVAADDNADTDPDSTTIEFTVIVKVSDIG